MITNESPRLDPGAPRALGIPGYSRAAFIAERIVNGTRAEQIKRGVAPIRLYAAWDRLSPGMRVDMIKAVAQLQHEGLIL